MDPDATVAEIYAADDALARGEITRAEHLERIAECAEALREWRRKGGFPPRDGWLVVDL